MKNPSEWKWSDKPFTLGDMVNTEIIKRGQRSKRYMEAWFNFMQSRLDDPEVSEDDLLSLSGDDLNTVVEAMMASVAEVNKMQGANALLRRMVNEVHEAR